MTTPKMTRTVNLRQIPIDSGADVVLGDNEEIIAAAVSPIPGKITIVVARYDIFAAP